MNPGARGIYARMAMLVEGVAGPGAADLAERLALPGDARLEVRHRAEQTVLTLGTAGGDAGFHAEVLWRRGASVEKLRSLLAGLSPDAWPKGAPLELLLPDVRSLETHCACQGRQPCRHALATVYAFARAAEADPSVLCRDARLKAQELGDAAVGADAPQVMPGPPSPARAFWLYEPPAAQLTAEERDFPMPSDGDPFHGALLAAMRAVRDDRLL
jgi:hypothetical protein